MTTKNIVKISGIIVAVIGAISLVSQHPILVIISAIGCGAFYFADKYMK